MSATRAFVIGLLWPYLRVSLPVMDGLLDLFELAQEEAAEEEQLPPPRAKRVYEIRPDPLTKYSDKKFLKRYRITKETFRWLLGVIQDDLLSATDKNHALTPAQQLSVVSSDNG